MSNKKTNESGIALIIAIMIIAVIVSFTTDLILKSQVDFELVVASRDNIRAEFAAESALNLGKFMVVADLAVDLASKQQLKKEPVDSTSDLWAKLNGFPISNDPKTFQEYLQALQIIIPLEDKFSTQLQELPGEFQIDIEDEASKINLNFGAQGFAKEMIALMSALSSCPAEQEYLKEKNIDFEPIIYRIKDWVDDNIRAESKSGYGSEDDPYGKNDQRYAAKNAPFDSLEELMLVDGWNEELHAIFSPYLTVFPVQTSSSEKPQLNINTLPKALLGCLFPGAKLECNKKYHEKFIELKEEPGALATSPKEIKGILKDIFCNNPKDEKAKNYQNVFATRSNTFRIKATAEVGDQVRSIEAIISRQIPNPSKKITKSSKYLYWKKI